MKQVEALPYDPSTYKPDTFDPMRFPVAPFTPKVLICPTDDEPLEAHSYVLNMHLSDKGIRAASRDFGGLRSSEVIVAGEKRNTVHDYYMARNDFHRVVDEYKHGAELGSNYLFFDGHVDNTPPDEELTGMDPWDLRVPDLGSTTLPTTEP
jgi:prepilin-type processing-associated H-X9-DG protein